MAKIELRLRHLFWYIFACFTTYSYSINTIIQCLCEMMSHIATWNNCLWALYPYNYWRGHNMAVVNCVIVRIGKSWLLVWDNYCGKLLLGIINIGSVYNVFRYSIGDLYLTLSHPELRSTRGRKFSVLSVKKYWHRFRIKPRFIY